MIFFCTYFDQAYIKMYTGTWNEQMINNARLGGQLNQRPCINFPNASNEIEVQYWKILKYFSAFSPSFPTTDFLLKNQLDFVRPT